MALHSFTPRDAYRFLHPPSACSRGGYTVSRPPLLTRFKVLTRWLHSLPSSATHEIQGPHAVAKKNSSTSMSKSFAQRRYKEVQQGGTVSLIDGWRRMHTSHGTWVNDRAQNDWNTIKKN
ncbi:hypothetical protein L1987_29663 [Smallanthus sonchifolius]|uniref:Uncharacterized protein n=1 Tax=Smallanthus sonchifolius TaxID=185202 RepID=A0ACB9I0M5_9ASTR|nr:hypothetical protein L1987_29663 [Smallanthus sonchifolius]